MNIIENKIEMIKSEKRMGFMGHVVAGYPNMETSYNAALGISAGGADFIEVQFPFSDPFADGPAIENACIKSLENGLKTEECFNLTERIVKDSSSAILIMTYGNIAFKYGLEKFLKRAHEIGVCGVIIPDLIPESDEGLIDLCQKYDLYPIMLAAPGNGSDRIEFLSRVGKGFIYTVARAGTTGNNTEINPEVVQWLEKVRNNSILPSAVGFGINSNQQIRNLSNHCDIAIAGSHFVREIEHAVGNQLDVREHLKFKTSELLCL